MAGLKQVLSLSDDLARYLKACGKTSVLQTKPVNPTQLKGLKFVPDTIGDTFKATNTDITKLVEAGYTNKTATKLLKYFSLEDLLKFDKAENLEVLFEQIDSIRTASEITSAIRPKFINVFEYMPKHMENVEVMELSSKIRFRDLYKKGLIQKSLDITTKELSEISTFNEGFAQMPSIGSKMVLYRGEQYYNHAPQLKILQNLKEGSTFKTSGYSWFTDSIEYAKRYANTFSFPDTKTSVIYRVLLSEESKIAVSRARLGQEFFMNNDENFKLVEKIFEPDVNRLYLFLEHLPY